MSTTARSTGRPARRAVSVPLLDRAADALAAKRTADVGLLVAAVEWAVANPAGPGSVMDPAGWGDPGELFGEGFLPLAGEGAPCVAESAPVELGAALGWTAAGAQLLMGDGLELRYRLPRVWSLVLDLRVPVHLAREIAQHTRKLTYDAARWADRLVSADPAHLDRVRVDALVREARLYHEPDLVVAEEENALASRRVDLRRGVSPATTDVTMTLDTEDAVAFDRAVAETAEALKVLGDEDELDLRRAKAVGVLADPRRALDLLTFGTEPGRTPARSVIKPAATLWLHLEESALLDLDTFPAAIGCDRLGAVSSDLLKMWLADTTVVVKPVLDLRRSDGVDRHDPPEWMADLIRLRDRPCVFPGCRRGSRACDLDHIEPYVAMDDGGPPGQTNPENLAPLCRRHHRAKTHSRWSYVRCSTAPTGGPHRPAATTPSSPPDHPDRSAERPSGWQDGGMERVLGVGGYFIRAADPRALTAWYRACLGLDADQNGLWRQEAGATVFATFESETDYFGSRAQQTMLNFRVRNLDAMLAQLRAKGADVAEETQDMDGVGRFGWVTDPEGNRVELWQPG